MGDQRCLRTEVTFLTLVSLAVRLFADPSLRSLCSIFFFGTCAMSTVAWKAQN